MLKIRLGMENRSTYCELAKRAPKVDPVAHSHSIVPGGFEV
jgi:hypothetical protein